MRRKSEFLVPQTNGKVFLVNPLTGQPIVADVATLVLETFVGPCPEGMKAIHINGDAEDNRLENLKWGTA